MVIAPDDHYTIISADCHAGANHETYRSYLEGKYLDDFDTWHGKYKNPFRDLQDGGRVRNWDSERRRGDLHADGQVGGGAVSEHCAAVLSELRVVRAAAASRSA